MGYNEEFMKEALLLAAETAKEKNGDPFGCVIVKNGKIIVRASNQLHRTNDPTTHAELEAIRQATRGQGSPDLSDCELYTSGEPCPMCEAAINWSKIPVVYMGKTLEEAREAGIAPSPEEEAPAYASYHKPVNMGEEDPYTVWKQINADN